MKKLYLLILLFLIFPLKSKAIKIKLPNIIELNRRMGCDIYCSFTRDLVIALAGKEMEVMEVANILDSKLLEIKNINQSLEMLKLRTIILHEILKDSAEAIEELKRFGIYK